MDEEFDRAEWYSDATATFGDRLAAAREAAGLKPKQLAQKVGVKAGTLRNWEQDLSEPRANRLSMLSGILGVSLGWLLNGEGEGVAAPETRETPPELAEVLADLRHVRVQLKQSNEALARLEKRLKSMGT